jgi:hypothetical protein
MAQIDLSRLVSLPLLAENSAKNKEQSHSRLCPVFGLMSALRSLSSVALSSA